MLRMFFGVPKLRCKRMGGWDGQLYNLLNSLRDQKNLKKQIKANLEEPGYEF